MITSSFEKCLYIKKLVEKFGKFPDISKNTNKREYSDLRKIYCKICNTTTDASLRIIGSTLRPGFKHDLVLHNIRRFDELFFTKEILFPDVYLAVLNALKKQDSGFDDVLTKEYTKFLNWFRIEINETTPVDSSFFVGKYFSDVINK
jgi:hypothetical protein